MNKIIFALSILLLFTYCDKPSKISTGSDFTVISLAPSVTEMIYYVGKGDHLIANTINSDYPNAALALPKIGNMIDIDIEKIVSLEPDIVIASFSGNSRDKVERLETLGVKVVLLREDRVEDIISNLAVLGDIFSMDASAYQDELSAKLGIVMENAKNSEKLKAMVILSVSPIYSASKSTFVGNAIEICGFENVVDSPVAYPVIDKESLLNLAPDILFLMGNLTNEETVLKKILSELNLDSELVFIDADALSRPAPRVFDLMIELSMFASKTLPLSNQTNADYQYIFVR